MSRLSTLERRADRAHVLPRCVALALVALPFSASAADLSLSLEPDVAIPLGAPQSEVFNVGVGQTLKARIGITPFLDVGPSASFQFLPTADPLEEESGVAWGFGAGLRLKRANDAESMGGISPWLDADAVYVRTGDLARPGFDVGVGVAAPIGDARTVWIGPFARYLQVMQPEHHGFDNRDARLLTLGVSFEARSGKRAPEEPIIVQAEPCPECDEVCPDRDADGIPDSVDRCPAVIGTQDNWGCPEYEKVIVKPDKLELREKLYFAWDEATLEPASLPVLDEVAKALHDNQEFRVQVEGHTDSTGGNAHNQDLSERRAEAVLDYLVGKGISKDRLVSKGFSSSVPTSTNTTEAGREDNRRVEFVVYFIILDDGSAK